MRDNKFGTLASVKEKLDKIPGMTELIEAEYAALRAAEFIRETRVSAHLSRAALAERLGVSAARITEVEAGEGPNGPTISLLARIAKACGGTLELSIRHPPLHVN